MARQFVRLASRATHSRKRGGRRATFARQAKSCLLRASRSVWAALLVASRRLRAHKNARHARQELLSRMQTAVDAIRALLVVLQDQQRFSAKTATRARTHR